MKTLLLTGAAGFLGRTIARHFLLQGWLVYGVDRVAAENAPLKDLQGYAEISLPHPSLDELLKQWKPQACIHAAGRASVPQSMQDPSSDYQDGPALTFYLLDSLRRFSPQCAFVFLSSAAVYGNPESLPVSEDQSPAPISIYGYHKWQSEILCAEFAGIYNINTASARLFSAYGVGLRRQVVWDITQKAMTQNNIILQGDGNESRDFVHSTDIARALECLLLSAPMHGEAYNVSSGEETRIAELAELIAKQLRRSVTIQFPGALPPGTPRNWRADIRRIAALGFAPQIPLQEGIAAFVNWCKESETDTKARN